MFYNFYKEIMQDLCVQIHYRNYMLYHKEWWGKNIHRYVVETSKKTAEKLEIS